MPTNNPKVDTFLAHSTHWRDEISALRKLLLAAGLDEDLKWGKPCYALNGRNAIIIQPFKHYLALLFFKGALLNDPHNILVKTGANTHAGRQIRFATLKEISARTPAIKAFIKQAIAIETSGLKVPPKNPATVPFPPELQTKFNELPPLKTAFNALTPGRQRGYLFFFSAAKQSQTRTNRINKHTPHILRGKGLND